MAQNRSSSGHGRKRNAGGRSSSKGSSFGSRPRSRDDERPSGQRFSKPGFKKDKPAGGSSRFRKDDSEGSRARFSKPGFKRDRPEGGYSRPNREEGGSSRSEGPRGRFTKSGFKRDRPEGGYSRPGRGEEGSSRSGGPRGRFSKPGFKKDRPGGGYSRPNRRDEGSSRSEGPRGRFSKPGFKRDRPEGGYSRPRGEEGTDQPRKPFRKRDEGDDAGKPSFRKYGQRPTGGKRFERREDDRGDRPRKKEFGKPGRSDDGERPPRKSFVDSRLDNQKRNFRDRSASEAEGPKDDLIRLNKYISNSGVCSRREADDLIAMGLVTVNGTTVTEMGYKVKPTDDVRYEGKRLKAEMPVYILLNKPKGYITTTDDPQERQTVMNLIAGACKERVYPVGRLDRNTSGLLLLTNDGDLTEKLSHPSYNVKKIYKAELDRPITRDDFQKIKDGVRLEEGKAVVDDVAIVSDDGKTVGLEIHIGWNRIVRRIFEALGYEVVKLDRSVYATLDKKDLPRGHWRFLRPDEVVRLKHFL